ncbi:MAG: FAD-dependent oxidoreductase [Planctomycetota bacterium]|jgi:glycerol-3-phosphate dehydrogenase
MIERNILAVTERDHDLLIVGGGSARRGYRPLLLERADFGGETSWNSLRIVHGGLRYLQRLDLPRFRESVAERRWFLRHFPDLVRPLQCLMPLYGHGLRRPAVMKTALALNDLMARRGNSGVSPDSALPRGRLLDPAETRRVAPAVRVHGLRGAVEWWDASIEDAPRLLMEGLRWAAAAGATCLNYVEVTEVLTEDGHVDGVAAKDRLLGSEFRFRAPVVVDCAGPKAGRLAGFHPSTFSPPSLAFNLLLDRLPPSDAAMAVTPTTGGPTYFLRSWQGLLLAGTYHASRPPAVDEARPTPSEIREFLKDLNASLPGLEVDEGDVLRVMAGLLPATRPGRTELATKPRILDHADRGGPPGLLSVSGIKYTTARAVAERVLRRVFGNGLSPIGPVPRPAPVPRMTAEDFTRLQQVDPEAARALVIRIAREESVVEVEDFLYRRTDWGTEPRTAAALTPWIRRVLQSVMDSSEGPAGVD